MSALEISGHWAPSRVLWRRIIVGCSFLFPQWHPTLYQKLSPQQQAAVGSGLRPYFVAYAADWDYYQHTGVLCFLFFIFIYFLGRTTLLRKLAVGFRASALEREETGGPLAASGQRYG